MSAGAVLVQKYGGTSVSTRERREQVVQHVRRARDEGWQVAIVVSAMGRRGDPYATDTLLDLLRSEGSPVDGSAYDLIFACGEIISTAVMAHLLTRAGIPAAPLTGSQAGIYTDDHHGEAEILEIDPSLLRSYLERGMVPVVAGCQGVDRTSGEVTTLGRGGSDTSGVALGVALGAARVDIYTDVEGVSRADPRLVPGAGPLSRISHDKMYEMGRFGAKVVHPRAVRTAREGGTPVVVRSTFSQAPGTLVTGTDDEHPLLAIAQLGSCASLALAAGSIDEPTRAAWEQQYGVVSIIDTDSSQVVLGTTWDKADELWGLVDAARPDRASRIDEQCWVSLVGDGAAVRSVSARGRELLEYRRIAVKFQECAAQRCTYVVPASAEADAVRVLYHGLLSRG